MRKIYNKLVRDKISDICDEDIKNGRIRDYTVRNVEKQEILGHLKSKLQEEIEEVLEVYSLDDASQLKEELADVIEVIDAILFHNKISLDEVIKIRDAKKERRGGFETGLFLESIDYIDGKEPK